MFLSAEGVDDTIVEVGATAATSIGILPPLADDTLPDDTDLSLSPSKRIIDIIVSLMALIVVAPVLVLIAIAIATTTRGPILFRQARTGYRGQPFRIIKFRTMTVIEDGDTIAHACRGDRRVTPVGRFLRASSLDEVPQLLNILLGDMSLVGPRPHALAHDRYYGALLDGYLSLIHI